MQLTTDENTKKPTPIPSWMTLDAQGVKIKLTVPSKINGIEVDTLFLRSPTLKEVRTAQKANPGEDEKMELMLFSSLADAGPNDLEGLKLKDYVRVQNAYFRMGDDDEL